MSNWSQGDVAGPMLWTWVTDAKPVTPEGARLNSSGPAFVKTEPTEVVVVSQTCDIRRSCWRADGKGRPFVQVSPLVHLTEPDLRVAAGGFIPRFAAVPGAGNDAFADLDQCTTIEKGVLARTTTRTVGCPSESDRQGFARAVARQRGRHAFPDCVEESISKLRAYLRDKRNRAGATGDAVRAIDSIRASASPAFSDTDPFDLSLTFVIDPLRLPAASVDEDDELSAWYVEKLQAHEDPTIEALAGLLSEASEPADQFDIWQRLAALWVSRCTQVGAVRSIGGQAESLLSYSLGRARREPNLDLDHLTSEEDRLEAGEVHDPA